MIKRDPIGQNAPGIDIRPNSVIYKKIRNNIASRFYDLMKSSQQYVDSKKARENVEGNQIPHFEESKIFSEENK